MILKKKKNSATGMQWNRGSSQTLGTLIFQGFQNFISRNKMENFAEMFVTLDHGINNVLRVVSIVL